MATAACRDVTSRMTNLEQWQQGKRLSNGRRVRLRVSVDCPHCGNLFTGYYVEQSEEWNTILNDHLTAGLATFYAENPHIPRSRKMGTIKITSRGAKFIPANDDAPQA